MKRNNKKGGDYMFLFNLPHILPGYTSTTITITSNNSPLANVFDFILKLFGK